MSTSAFPNDNTARDAHGITRLAKSLNLINRESPLLDTCSLHPVFFLFCILIGCIDSNNMLYCVMWVYTDNNKVEIFKLVLKED